MSAYYDYATNQYAPDSPDTFFARVDIQPPTEDSEQTPPSPVSKARRSVARPSQVQAQSSSTNSKRSSTSHGPSQQVRKERERQLANTPREALIQLAIAKEHGAREAKHLLTTAILQIESLRDRLRREEETRKTLEEETRALGMKTTKAILDAQKETLSAKEEIGTYKLKLENVERELKRAKDVVRIVEKERDEADKALVRARTTARTLKEQNILLQAQEEGRRLGFEEGLRQGRLLQESMPLEPEPVVQVPEPSPKDRKPSVDSGPSSSKHTSRRHARKSDNPSHETEAAIAALNKIHEDETFRIRSQLSKIEADLDRTIQEKKNTERERQALLDFKQRAEAENRRRELEREKEKMAIKELEREKAELKRMDSERVRRIKEEHRHVEEERERELRELRRERERLEREKADLGARAREDVERERERLKKAEEELEREKEREREREKETREETTAVITAAVTAAIGATTSHGSSPEGPPFKSQEYQRLPYLPMPPPPADAMPTPVVMPAPSTTTPGPFGVPLTNSVGSQRGHRRRDSFSSVASTAQYDMLQPPNGRDRGLGVIPEDASVRAPSPSHIGPAFMPMPTVPDWARDGSTDGWRSNTPGWQTSALPPSRGPEPVVSGGAPHWPEPTVPNIAGGPQSDSTPHWPEPNVPNIVGQPSSTSSGAAQFPEPTIRNIVGRSPSRNGGPGAQFPEPTIPNIVGRSPSRTGGAQFPEPTIPNIVGGPPASRNGGAAHFPEPTIPNIVGRPPSRSGGAAYFPEPTVPNIVGRPPSRNGGAQFPEPTVPNIVGKPSSSSGGGAQFPEPTIPNVVGRSPSRNGGAQFPEPTIPNIVGRSSSQAGRAAQFPEPTVPNIVGRPPSRSGGAQFPEPTVPNIIGRSPSRADNATPSWPDPSVPNIVQPGVSGGKPHWPEPSIPNIMERPASRTGNAAPQWPTPGVPNVTGRDTRGMGAGPHSSPYTNPNLLAPSNPNPLMRRTSSGSTSSYEILIEPPSRPESRTNIKEDDGNGHWLSPNHSSVPLPTAPRGPPTQSNSSVVLQGPIPANFVPHTFTDRNGMSTPIWQANSLPSTTAPVIPGVTTSTGSQKYGNPLHKDMDEDGPPVFPRSPKSPNRRLSGTPGAWVSGGRAGSFGGGGGGMTPASSTRDLPGVGSGNRTSIFGGVMSSPARGPSMQMPEPTVPFIPPPAEEIEEDDGFDQTTMQNTMMNATMGKKSAPGKKKKKR